MARHRWSGWPGAWCLDCGQEDGMEIAIADGDFDPETDCWSSPEVQADYQRRYPKECPHPGDGRFGPYVSQKQE